MALRLRYEVDAAARLRAHVHVVDGIGYFFFPGVSAPKGTRAFLELVVHHPRRDAREDTATLRGHVWTRPATGGVWLELPEAGACVEALEAQRPRFTPRLATDQLVLAQGQGLPGLLCRLRDVGLGGARIAASAADLGQPGGRIRIALPEAGPGGDQLEAFGRVVWALGEECGLEWDRDNLVSRAAVLRLVQIAEEQWAGARCASHPPGCPCELELDLAFGA